MPVDSNQILHLRGGGVSLVTDVSKGVPTIVYWGEDLGDHDSRALMQDRLELGMSLVPEHGSGFPGRQGLAGSRSGGRRWASRFSPERVDRSMGRVVVSAVDHVAGLGLDSTLEIDPVSGLVRASAILTNQSDDPYRLAGLTLTFPLDGHASEVLQFSGRWSNEFVEVRKSWESGAITAENRGGLTSHDHVPTIFVGDAGFTNDTGRVWGAHLGWSGNTVVYLERLSDGRRYLQLGELLHPGELELESGDTYETPTCYLVYSPAGTNAASQAFHRHVRARPGHPGADDPRPVTFNTWEAIYFDLSMGRLTDLATTAATVGVERFVLDDGWFHGRRSDDAGLGDWWVDSDVFPDGLGPLISAVQDLGMDFGIWVEPEMMNPDSDLYRSHPEWALVDAGYDPELRRDQLVLDLANEEAYAYIFGLLDALLSDHDISYVKWDMNRPHIQGSHGGRAGTHVQTLSLYRLLDDLQRRHPTVEFESCASGGGRADFGILERAVRVWASDGVDALDRHSIQRGFLRYLPQETMGAHIGSDTNHITGRRHTLGFRAATAFLGHLGIEADLATFSDHQLAEISSAVSLYKEHRALLNGGDFFRLDHSSNTLSCQGVFAADRSEAIVVIASLETSEFALHPPLQVPQLVEEATYTIERLPFAWVPARAVVTPQWVDGPVEMTGRQLRTAGLVLPAMRPESALVLHVRRSDSPERGVSHRGL